MPRCSSMVSLRWRRSCSFKALSPARRPFSNAACSRSRMNCCQSCVGEPTSRHTSRSGRSNKIVSAHFIFGDAGIFEFNFAFGFELAHGVNDAELRGLDIARLDVAEKRDFLLHGFGGAARDVAEQQSFQRRAGFLERHG